MSEQHPLGSSARFEALGRLVPTGARVADIGTDRAAFPRWLLVSGRASFCVATERDAKRLALARAFPAGHPLGRRLELRAGDGLEVLSPRDRVQVVIVAGLGAAAICRILGNGVRDELGLDRLVLQPTTDPAIVRRFLFGHGLRIVEEQLVLERSRFSTVIAAEPGGACLPSDDLLEAGPCLVRAGNAVVELYWRRELARQELILRTARGGRGRLLALRRRDLSARVLATLRKGTAA